MNWQSSFSLWLRWVGANALAELIGLGATFALDFVIITRIAAGQSAFDSILGIILVTASGAVEGVVVGLLQWSVMHRPFPGVARRAWVIATVAGAVVQEPPAYLVLLLAAAMGVVLGSVLGYPQWRVLRKATRGAWLWIPANCAAWGLGMPAVFAAIDVAQRSPSPAGVLSAIAIGLLFTGGIVGAVHGLALVRLVTQAPAR
jgi:hypothetical protein